VLHTAFRNLTVKSDDVSESKIYEALVKGKTRRTRYSGIFQRSIKELRSLCLDVQLLEED
jgi:DNA-directed RNA polymerase beta subunit